MGNINNSKFREGKMKKAIFGGWIVSFAIVSLLFVGSTVHGADTAIKMRFASASFPGLPTYAMTDKFAEVMKEKSNGRILIQAIQQRKLGADLDLIELVKGGAVDMANVSTAVFDGFVPDLDALQLPFLIKDYDALQKVFLADYTTKLLSVLEKLHMHGIGLNENGLRGLANNVRPIYKPADLKNIKMRVGECKMHQEIFSALGAIPIPISYGEIYTSLKTGVISGTEINATSAASEKLMEVIKYYATIGHFFWPSVAVINLKTWNKLSPEDRKLFEDTWHELIPWQINICRTQDAKAMKTMKKRGIVITNPDKKAFYDKCEFIYQKYMKYPAIDEFVKSVRAMQ
jgi:tripartite ATP-independent transporter DctP family solute receptor